MKLTLTTDEVANRLIADSNAAWTRAGAFALAEHFEDIERESATELEMDICAIRCDFSEYASATLAALSYGWKTDDDKSTEENETEALNYLTDRTSVLSFNGGVITQNF